MRAITVMYDSLNRNYLPPYGDTLTIAPNFTRLAEKAVAFDNFYVGSLPCMPARRELHTGRLNFLHRPWGPLEPFDNSMPKILSDNGVYTHCVTDHCHYWELGGAGYLEMFSSCERVRGQEGDAWYGQADGFTHNMDQRRQDPINRRNMPREEDHTHARSFAAGMKFLQENVHSDNWYLHLEYFDPHEPYFVPQKYKDLYAGGDKADFDWPRYGPTAEGSREVVESRINYRALVSMCDHYLGLLLDFMDEHDMWKDTMLVVNTDHGYLIGEHGNFGKNIFPNFDQLAHTPFFAWDPRSGGAGERRDGLAQTIDIAPTILEFFGLERPPEMLGRPIRPLLENRGPIHDHVLFGYFGKHVNITDGRHVYMRCGRESGEGRLNYYTLMPHHIFEPFALEDLARAELTRPDEFAFSRGAPILRVPAANATAPKNTCYMFDDHLKYGDLLFDLASDPGQTRPLRIPAVEDRLAGAMQALLMANEAPPELFRRMGV